MQQNISSVVRRAAPLRLGSLQQRSIWGVAPATEPDLYVPLDVESPVPLFDGPTPTKVTTLDNGLKVASSDLTVPVTTVGVYIDTGSRYEAVPGTAHVLQHLAFKSSTSRSQLKFVRDCEKIGAVPSAMAARENMVYQIDVLKQSVPEAVAMLAETITSPKLLPWEISSQARFVKTEVEEFTSNPQQYVTDLVHPAAYGAQSPLGKPLHAKGLYGIDAGVLGEFVDAEYVPNKMVLAAAGYNHDELVTLAKSFFGGAPAAPVMPPPADTYVGGEFRLAAELPSTHFALAFEGVGWKSDALVPLCVLNTLMGGGASFSAGGPGKGMYTRLYQNILNRFPMVEAASVFNTFYNETGVFGVYGSTDPASMGALVAAVVDEMKKMTGQITDVELSRAKNQLTSSLLMNLESRPVLFEDIGRQVLTYGKRIPPEELVKQIAAVTAADLNKVASTMLKTPPSIVAYGDTTCVPRYDLIAKQFS